MTSALINTHFLLVNYRLGVRAYTQHQEFTVKTQTKRQWWCCFCMSHTSCSRHNPPSPPHQPPVTLPGNWKAEKLHLWGGVWGFHPRGNGCVLLAVYYLVSSFVRLEEKQKETKRKCSLGQLQPAPNGLQNLSASYGGGAPSQLAVCGRQLLVKDMIFVDKGHELDSDLRAHCTPAWTGSAWLHLSRLTWGVCLWRWRLSTKWRKCDQNLRFRGGRYPIGWRPPPTTCPYPVSAYKKREQGDSEKGAGIQGLLYHRE